MSLQAQSRNGAGFYMVVLVGIFLIMLFMVRSMMEHMLRLHWSKSARRSATNNWRRIGRKKPRRSALMPDRMRRRDSFV